MKRLNTQYFCLWQSKYNEQNYKHNRKKTCNFKQIGWSWSFRIFNLHDYFVWNWILFIKVHIGAYHPNIKYVKADSSPKRKEVIKWWISLQWNICSVQNDQHKYDDSDNSSYQNSNKKSLVFKRLWLFSKKPYFSPIFSNIARFHFNVVLLNLFLQSVTFIDCEKPIHFVPRSFIHTIGMVLVLRQNQLFSFHVGFEHSGKVTRLHVNVLNVTYKLFLKIILILLRKIVKSPTHFKICRNLIVFESGKLFEQISIF